MRHNQHKKALVVATLGKHFRLSTCQMNMLFQGFSGVWMEQFKPNKSGNQMIDACPIVAVIEAGPILGQALQGLLQAAGLTVELFKSTAAYMRTNKFDANCIVADPQFGGLDLQSGLAEARALIPIVLVTADADVRMAVRAMKDGAVEYLVTPLLERELLDAVRCGVALDLARRTEKEALSELQERFTSLSSREREILMLLSRGRQAKQIANQLHICTHTARVHSNRVMSKLGARSIADLVRMADKLAHPANGMAVCGIEIHNSNSTRCLQPRQSNESSLSRGW
jgi:FixJ family two-component response regulator